MGTAAGVGVGVDRGWVGERRATVIGLAGGALDNDEDDVRVMGGVAANVDATDSRDGVGGGSSFAPPLALTFRLRLGRSALV